MFKTLSFERIPLAWNILTKRYVSRLKEGTKLPEVALQEGAPNKQVKITDLFAGKKGVLLGVPGAFTPTCSNSHLPGFIKNIELVRQKGYSVVACVTVNDAFVTQAWSDKQKAEGKVRLLADPNADFTKAIYMEKEIPPLGGIRSKRYTLLIDNNLITKVFEEPDGTGGSCSLAENVLKFL